MSTLTSQTAQVLRRYASRPHRDSRPPWAILNWSVSSPHDVPAMEHRLSLNQAIVGARNAMLSTAAAHRPPTDMPCTHLTWVAAGYKAATLVEISPHFLASYIAVAAFATPIQVIGSIHNMLVICDATLNHDELLVCVDDRCTIIRIEGL